MCAKTKDTIVLFNPMPVKHPVAIPNKKTTSHQVPLVNVPLSLLAISRLVKDNYQIKILNAVVDEDYKEKVFAACKYALCLSVSSMTCYQIRDGIEVCASVKEQNPDLPVIWGGYHPSTAPAQTLENPYIDIVIRGQGELTFRDVVEKLENGDSFDDIPGISYKKGGKVINNPDRNFETLDSFPPIPYDLIDVERHIKGYKFGRRCLDYYTSQGCAQNCSFCSEPLFFGRHWSSLKPMTVVSELEHLAKDYDIDTFMIRDSDFFLNIRRVKELCELLIEKNLDIRLTSVNGRMEQVSRIGDGIFSLFRRAGIAEIFIGFESGCQEALDVMNKGARTDDIRSSTEICLKHDIDLRGSFMVGIPGVDPHEEVKNTFQEIHDIICAYGNQGKLEHLDILLSFFTPYPNTSLYRKSVEHGMKPLDTLFDWGDFDQFDFKAPWFPQEYYDIARDFRANMPWNSGCELGEWREFFQVISQRLETLN